MTSEATAIAVNPFAPLGHETKGIDDNPETHEEKDKLVERICSQTFSSISELAEAISEDFEMGAEMTDTYKTGFTNWSSKEYSENFYRRCECFKEKEHSEFMAVLRERLDVFHTIELRPLIDRAITDLAKNEKTGYGILWLIGVVVSTRPDLLTSDLLCYTPDPLVDTVISWIASKATESSSISHLDPLLSHQLLQLFLPEMLNSDQERDAMAVSSAHLVVNAFNNQKIYRVSAEHYAKLLKLVNNTKKTKREKLVIDIINPIMKKLTVVDMKDFARQMMEVFPQAPPFACALFRRNTRDKKGNACFVDGWIEAHSSHKKVSMLYLQRVFAKLPETVVNKFPMEDLKEGGDLASLAAMKLELTNSSFRLLFMVLCALVFCYFYYR